MKKVIVTTTINPPTEAIERFDAMAGWELVVIGDLKTPQGYKLQKGMYVTPADQEKYDRALSDAIGWNCIQRRNFGLLLAKKELKADIIAMVDDDNIPNPGWGENLSIGKEVKVNFYQTDLPAFDPLAVSGYPQLWHRGFPLPLLHRRAFGQPTEKVVVPSIQADLWNGAPDVDAVCRMQYMPECEFNPAFFPLASNALSPFNSQNTFLSADLVGDFFLYPHVGRMDDIWASYYIQARGAVMIYGPPSVYQLRNEHDPIKDMKMEYMGYEHNLSLVQDIAGDAEKITRYLPERSLLAWQLFKKHCKEA